MLSISRRLRVQRVITENRLIACTSTAIGRSHARSATTVSGDRERTILKVFSRFVFWIDPNYDPIGLVPSVLVRVPLDRTSLLWGSKITSVPYRFWIYRGVVVWGARQPHPAWHGLALFVAVTLGRGPQTRTCEVFSEYLYSPPTIEDDLLILMSDARSRPRFVTSDCVPTNLFDPLGGLRRVVGVGL